MERPTIVVDKIVAGIKDNLRALRSIKTEEMTAKERVEFRKDIEELRAMALAIKNKSK